LSQHLQNGDPSENVVSKPPRLRGEEA